MSQLNAVCYFNEDVWRFDFYPGHTSELDIAIGFDIRHFDALSFGYQFGDIVCRWPKDDITYHASYEDFIHIERNFIAPNTEISLTFTATDSGKTVIGETTLRMPKPQSPHASWVWSDTENTWIPPVTCPDDESQRWHWNEEEMRWVGFPRLTKVIYLD